MGLIGASQDDMTSRSETFCKIRIGIPGLDVSGSGWNLVKSLRVFKIKLLDHFIGPKSNLVEKLVKFHDFHSFRALEIFIGNTS